MGLVLEEEREVEAVEDVFPRLAFSGPARDIETEIQAARAEGYNQAARDLGAEYNSMLAKRMPRAPLAAEMVPVLEALATILGIRVMIFVALIATFALAWVAMADPRPAALVLVGMFGLITLVPLAYLATRRTG